MANFKRNEELVKPDNLYAGKIREQGFYAGKFTQAYIRKGANSESEALHLEFLADTGHSESIDIWHTNRNGGEIESGMRKVNDLMVLLSINELKEKKNDKIEVFDFVVRAVIDKIVTSYPQLIGKPIGTVFKIVEYVKQINVDGRWVDTNPPQLAEKAELVLFCDAKTKSTVYEFNAAKDPVYVDKYLSTLQVKRISVDVQSAKDAQVVARAENKAGPTIAFVDDDDDYDSSIPF